MDALTRMYHTLNPRMHEKAAKVHRWFTMSYKQWQETGSPVGVDKEHDEEFVEELEQRRDANGVPEASAADRDIMLDTKRALDDTTNSEPAPPAKKAKGPLLTPPEDEMKGPTLQQIFTLFVLVDKNKGRNLEWLEWLERNCQSYGWGMSEHSYYEMGEEVSTRRGGPNLEMFGSAYLKLHGSKVLCPNIDIFLSDFVPRKMDADFRDMKRCAATLRALVKFCISQGYLEKDDAKVKHTLKSISVCGKFDAEGVRNSLQQLKNTGYWKRLREQREDDGETDHEAEDEYDYDCRDESGDADEYPVEGDEFRMGDFYTECSSVRKNGWVFMREMFSGQARVLLYLPPEVAKLGRAGMLISCMEFVYLGRGVWEPKADDEDFHNTVCANVYPPNN